MRSARYFRHPWLRVCILALPSSLASVPADEDYMPKVTALAGYVKIPATESFEALSNPGKGWVSYNRLGRDKAPATADHLRVVSTGYGRYQWSEIQPDSEMNYDWSAIDADLRHCASQGMKFAFGVMSENAYAKQEYVTPKWVFDAGAQALAIKTVGLPGFQGSRHHVPVWNDAVYLRKLEGFVQALAARYDGHPALAFLDIRSYGNYGENHMHGLGTGSVQPQYITAEELLQYLKIYRRYFQRTQLVFCVSGFHFREYWPVWAKAVELGITLRLDAVPSAKDELFKPLQDAIGKLPTIFEFPDAYTKMKQLFNYRELADRVELAKPSYVSLGHSVSDGNRLVAEQRDYVDYLANRIGYHFVLQNTLMPGRVRAGEPVEVIFNVANKGVAPLFGHLKFAVVLINQSGERLRKCWLEEITAEQILPGTSNALRARVTLDDVPDGTYRLALGIFEDQRQPHPLYRFGNENRTPDCWLIAAEGIRKAGGYFTFAGLNPGEIAVSVDGRPLAFAQAPRPAGNDLLVPIDGLGEALGAVVQWDLARNSFTARLGPKSAVLTMASRGAVVDGREVSLERAPVRLGATALVPVRSLCAALGVKLAWNPEVGEALISTRSAERPIPPTPPRPPKDPRFRASSEWDSGYGVRSANFAFDGDSSTAWAAAGSPPQWVERDFGGPTTFSGVFLKEFSQARIQQFAVQYFSDGEYRDACTGTTIGLDGITARFLPVTGTRLRLMILKTLEGRWPLVDEITILSVMP